VDGPDPKVRAGQAGHVVAVVEPRHRVEETAAAERSVWPAVRPEAAQEEADRPRPGPPFLMR
jgi:hypothetical protein